MDNISKSVLGLGALIVIVLIVAWFLYDGGLRSDNTDVGVTPTELQTPTQEPLPTNDVSPNDDSDEQNITIESPKTGETVGLPVVVEGKARVFENTLQVRVRDGDGRILDERFVTADGEMGQFGSYRVELFYAVSRSGSGTIEAFEYSPRDGSEVNKIIIPVRFSAVDSLNVNVFFSNREEDPNLEDCAITYPAVRRIPHTQTTARAALEQLFSGPTNIEGQQGFFTNINAAVNILGLRIENQVAYADFSRHLGEGVAGSCRVQAIRSQIESTLTQFPTISEVVISIEGQEEGILEP